MAAVARGSRCDLCKKWRRCGGARKCATVVWKPLLGINPSRPGQARPSQSWPEKASPSYPGLARSSLAWPGLAWCPWSPTSRPDQGCHCYLEGSAKIKQANPELGADPLTRVNKRQASKIRVQHRPLPKSKQANTPQTVTWCGQAKALSVDMHLKSKFSYLLV